MEHQLSLWKPSPLERSDHTKEALSPTTGPMIQGITPCPWNINQRPLAHVVGVLSALPQLRAWNAALGQRWSRAGVGDGGF